MRPGIERVLVSEFEKKMLRFFFSSIPKSFRTCCGNPHNWCVMCVCKLTANMRARFWACEMKGQLVRAGVGVSAVTTVELRRICVTGRRHVRVRGGTPAQCE